MQPKNVRSGNLTLTRRAGYMASLAGINSCSNKAVEIGAYRADVTGLLGKASGSFAALWFENEPAAGEKRYAVCRHEWRSPKHHSANAASASLAGMRIEYDSGAGISFARLSSGTPLFVRLDGKKRPCGHEFGAGTKAFIALPLFIKKEYFGFIRLDSDHIARKFCRDEMSLLRIASTSISAALEYGAGLNALASHGASSATGIELADRLAGFQRYERRYNELFSNVNDIVCTMDFEGVISSINRYAEKVTGYRNDRLAGGSFKEFMIPRYIPLFEKMLELARSGMLHNTNFETELTTSDGGNIFLEMNNYVIYFDGKPSEIFCIARDITERKRSEIKLKRTEEILSGVLNNSGDAVMAFDALRNDSGRIIDFECRVVNSAAERITGKMRAELVGRRLLGDMSGSGLAELFEKFRRVVESGMPLYYEHKMVSGESCLWLRISATKLSDGIVVNFSDVTYQKQYEKELQEQLNFNEILLDSLPYPATLVNGAGRVLALNNRAAIMGAAIGENYQKSWMHEVSDEMAAAEHAAADCFFCAAATAMFEKRSLGRAEVPALDRLWDMRVIYVYEDLFLFFAVEVTENRNLKNELAVMQHDSQSLENIKRNFLANMSHELRTPMNIIIGFTELLSETEINAEQSEFIRHINESSLALLGIINDIIDYSNLEADRLEIECVPFKLEEIVSSVVESNRPLVSKKGLAIEYSIEPEIYAIVHGDPGRLRQVLMNLVNNAVKFSMSGTVRVGVVLENDSGSDQLVRFEVSDEGVGISPERQQEMFSPFTQADASITRNFGGLGLGLTLANHLVRLLGGKRIFLESAPGAGSTFFFTLDFKRQ